MWTGIASDGAAYRIEVPPQWNGTLVMYAHGFRGTGNVVWVDEPQLRQYFVDHGYAWAASSYAMNGYDPGDGVVDTHDLLKAFPAITGLHPRRAIMTGLSMGGEITTAEIEAYKGDFVGAMPYCGVLAGNDLFDYYLGANVTAAGLTGTTITYPTTLAAGTAYAPAYQTTVQSELPALGITPNPATGGQTFATDLTRTGTLWADTVEQLSGGTRPGFQSALDYWDSFGFAPLTKIPFLFGLYPGTQRRDSRVRQRQRGRQRGHLLHLQRPALRACCLRRSRSTAPCSGFRSPPHPRPTPCPQRNCRRSTEIPESRCCRSTGSGTCSFPFPWTSATTR